MPEATLFRGGIIKGREITLESETGLPDGQAVIVQIGLAEDATAAAEEAARRKAADEALETIYRMRHTGRSVREL